MASRRVVTAARMARVARSQMVRSEVVTGVVMDHWKEGVLPRPETMKSARRLPVGPEMVERMPSCELMSPSMMVRAPEARYEEGSMPWESVRMVVSLVVLRTTIYRLDCGLKG